MRLCKTRTLKIAHLCEAVLVNVLFPNVLLIQLRIMERFVTQSGLEPFTGAPNQPWAVLSDAFDYI